MHALSARHACDQRAPRQVERYVLRLLGAAQRRRDAREAPPSQAFARQDAAFRWADAHPLAAELRCGSPNTCTGLFTLSRMCMEPLQPSKARGP